MRRLLAALMAFVALFAAASASAASLEEMAGQMIVIGFKGRTGEAATVRRIAGDIAAGRIGGVILFARNIADPAQLRALTSYLKDHAAGLPPVIAIDQEGGEIERLTRSKGFRTTPSAFYVARHESPEAAYRTYSRMARQLAASGINMNLGPVIDLDLNPDNPIIGKLNRSFGDDGQVVFKYARAFIEAHRAAGVLTCLKHWPGHGATIGDSHTGSVRVSPINRQLQVQVYADLVQARLADAVMASHVIPDRDKARLPASLNPQSLHNLRANVEFQGAVISDDMQMGAIRKRFGFADAVVRAVNAGDDLLIFGNMLTYDPDVGDKARAVIVAAVKAGKIKKARLDEAFAHISALKDQLRQ